jgi:Mor family transcriptional regulator
MKYKKAESVLPEALLNEVRKYIQGEYLYISKADGSKKKWGEKTGVKRQLTERNRLIRQAFQEGRSIEDLSKEYFLAVNTIKQIVYTKEK